MHIKVVLAVVGMVEVGAAGILADKLTLAGPRGEGKQFLQFLEFSRENLPYHLEMGDF